MAARLGALAVPESQLLCAAQRPQGLRAHARGLSTRHLTVQEEEALAAAVSRHGTLRDRTLPAVALYTGLRAEALCGLQPKHIHVGRRCGRVAIPVSLTETRTFKWRCRPARRAGTGLHHPQRRRLGTCGAPRQDEQSS